MVYESVGDYMVAPAVIGAAIGAAGNILGGMASNANSVYKQKQVAKYQASLNYKYAQKSALNSPSWNKEGLINAGLNPMLALGNQQGATTGWTTGSDSGTSDFSSLGSNAVSNAMAVKQQKNQDALSSAQVNNYNADSVLKNNQSITEMYSQLEKLNHADLMHAQKILTDKDVSWYDKKMALEQKRVANEIERTGNDFKVGMAQAIASQISAQGSYMSGSSSITNAQTSKDQLKLDKDRLKFDKTRFGVYSGLGTVGSMLIPGFGQLRAAKSAKGVFNSLHFIGR